MKVLFYMRYEQGRAIQVAIHSDYEGEEEEIAFFEAFSSATGDQVATARRLPGIIESFKRNLPYITTTMEFVDTAPERAIERDIYIYLSKVDVKGAYGPTRHIGCAFATFERQSVKAAILNETFHAIAHGGDVLAQLEGFSNVVDFSL